MDTAETETRARSFTEPVETERVPTYAWIVLGFMTLVQLFAQVDRFAIGVVVEPVRIEFKLTDTQLGLLSGMAFSLTYALAGIPMGVLIDRVHRRNMLAVVLTAWSLLTMVCGMARSFVMLFAARMAVGAAEAGVQGAVSILSDYFPARRRPLALSIYYAAASAAVVVTFGVGGWLAQAFGWRAVFLAAGVPGLILALAIVFCVKEPVRGAAEVATAEDRQSAPPLWVTLKYIVSCPSLRNLLLGSVIVVGMTSSFTAWVASFLIRIHGLDVKGAGLVVAFGYGTIGTVSAVLSGLVADRLATRRLIFVVYFLVAVALLMTPAILAFSFAPSLVSVIPAMVTLALLFASWGGSAQGMILNLAKVRMRGVTISVLMLSMTLFGYGVGPIITGAVSDMIGTSDSLRYGFACLFVFGLWAAFHFWRASCTLETDLVRASAPQAVADLLRVPRT